MKYTRLILIVTAIVFLCNFSLLLLVQKGGEAVILAVTIDSTEVILLSVAIWQWLQHHTGFEQRKFHKLH